MTKTLHQILFVLLVLTVMLCTRARGNPTTQSWLQSVADSPDAKTNNIVEISARTPTTQYIATPTPPVAIVPPPTSQPFAGQLKPGATYDGGKVTLKASLVVPPGAHITIRNADISFAGNGGKTGAGAMAAFQVGTGAILTLDHCRIDMGQKCAAVKLTTGGWISEQYVTIGDGAILWCEGGEYAEVFYPTESGIPDKYAICSFTAPLKRLVVVSDVAHPIRQGKHEAGVRLMDVINSTFTNVTILGSGEKYAVQDRWDSTPTGTGLHEWDGCTVDGGPHHANSCVSIGWMDKSAGIPANPLGTSRWTNCVIDGFVQEQKTCKRIEFINTRIGGKVTNQTLPAR